MYVDFFALILDLDYGVIARAIKASKNILVFFVYFFLL